MILKDFDAYLEENEEVEYSLFEEVEGEHCLWLEKRALYIQELKVKVYSGYCETWDECDEAYVIDFDFYMMFDSETGEHLYEESGSGLEASIYNFARSVRNRMLQFNEIEKLEFIIK